MISWRRKKTCKKLGAVPIASMYGIFTYIYHKNQPTVGKYTTHGSYGVAKLLQMHETSSHHSRTICRSFQPTEQPDFNLNYTRLKLNIDTKNDCLENVFQCINFLWIVAGLSISKYIHIYILIIEIIYIHIYIFSIFLWRDHVIQTQTNTIKQLPESFTSIWSNYHQPETSWWLNQPIWKIWSSNWDHLHIIFPK